MASAFTGRNPLHLPLSPLGTLVDPGMNLCPYSFLLPLEAYFHGHYQALLGPYPYTPSPKPPKLPLLPLHAHTHHSPRTIPVCTHTHTTLP